MKVRILIADDHLIVREGLKLIIETNPKYEIIGEATNGKEAVQFAEASRPDIILLDLNMPEMGGLDAMTALQARGLDIPVIILTTYTEYELMTRGLALGAKGYLLKDTGREMIFRSIDAAVRGETLLLPAITEKVFGKGLPAEEHKTLPAKNPLTYKELAVLQAVARGARSKEVGHELGISERTVKAHLTNIYNKLGVDSRMQAVTAAMELGILDL